MSSLTAVQCRRCRPRQVWAAADLVVLLLRSTAASVRAAQLAIPRLRADLNELGMGADRLAAVVIGPGRPYSLGEVKAALRPASVVEARFPVVPVIDTLPWDETAAEFLSTGVHRRRGFAGSKLATQAGKSAAVLIEEAERLQGRSERRTFVCATPGIRRSPRPDGGNTMTQTLGPEVDTISVDFALVRDIVDKVNDLIDQDAKQRGRRLGRTDERQFAMARTMDVIVREGAARARQGLDMWSEVQENAIRDAVMDSMFGLGRIQKWLLNPDIEDLYIAGTRPAHARLSDGSIVECGVVADTDEELIEQLRIIATHGSSTERQMVSSRPIIDMRLPDGQRAAGMWEVVPEPHLTIRCHRYVDITLEKLIGMGMVSRSMANFLYAAVRGRRSILVIGAPGAGKTTLLRALAQCVDRFERFATLETEYELFCTRSSTPTPRG